MSLQTVIAHAGCDAPSVHREATPPIHMASTFERNADGSYSVHVYGRVANPTRDLLEATVARLEGGGVCCAFGSGTQRLAIGPTTLRRKWRVPVPEGMAALSAVMQSLAPSDKILLPDDLYMAGR